MIHLGLVVIVSLILLFKIYQKITCGMCKCKTEMIGKVIIVTGANTGIGFETAKDLARRGAKVIMACRDEKKGVQARENIIVATGNRKVVLKIVDLASLKSVRSFCKDILETEGKIDVLINNAGMGNLDNHLTEDSITIETQVNYFGPFLLTVLLLPLLEASAPSRIINVSSAMHWFGCIDLVNFHKQANSDLSRRRVYSNTKLANILFTEKLSRVLQGTGVTVNSLHPGLVATDIFREKYTITRMFIKMISKTPWEGAQTTIHLAVSPNLENTSGRYFVDCKEAKTSSSANDSLLADKLWKLSEEIVFPKLDTELSGPFDH